MVQIYRGGAVKIIDIKAQTLPDAWFQSVYAILEHGREFQIDQGSFEKQYRLELDYITIHIKEPSLRCHDGLPLIPDMPEGLPSPCSKNYLIDYARYIMSSNKEPGEQYTYGERIEPQLSKVINLLKNTPRTNQAVIQIAQPSDIELSDPPCLRSIDCRVQDDMLHFYPYWRSWDCWAGMPANLGGISILQEYMADEIGVKQGEIIASSKGLHLYDYVVELAKIRCKKENSILTSA